jgi:hypothetical protein
MRPAIPSASRSTGRYLLGRRPIGRIRRLERRDFAEAFNQLIQVSAVDENPPHRLAGSSQASSPSE